jgi:hypothetical protein
MQEEYNQRIKTYMMVKLDTEIRQQDYKWGAFRVRPLTPEKMHVDAVRNYSLMIPSELQAKLNCDGSAKIGKCTWAHVLVEELCEAVEAKTHQEQVNELIQVAAVAIQAAMSVAIDNSMFNSKEKNTISDEVSNS